jgi:hypothetical protein
MGETFRLAVEIGALAALILAILTELHVQKLMRVVNGNINKTFQIFEKVKGLEQLSEIISESITTRYVGNFPDNMNEMIKLIPSTQKKLFIVCDVPAFGHFSNPEGFRQYSLALQTLLNRTSHKPEIILVNYDLKRRISNSASQFKMPVNELLDNDAYKNYFNYWGEDRKEPKVENLEDFCIWLDIRHQKFQADLEEKGAKVYETSRDLRAFVWIVDDREAIFSFYNYGSENREVSFRTNDKRLIESLELIARETLVHAVRREDL